MKCRLSIWNAFMPPHVRRGGVSLLLWSVLAVAASAAAAANGAKPPVKRASAELAVIDVNGATVRPLRDEGQKATLLFFIMHDCPVANSYAPEINRIVAEYEKVRCFVVYVESDLTAQAARAHVKDYGFQCGALLDPEHRLVQLTGATVSPEAALLSPAGDLLYRGRIDDRAADVGKRRVQPTRRDLRLALDAVLAGKSVPDRRTKAVGCYIPDAAPANPVKKSIAP